MAINSISAAKQRKQKIAADAKEKAMAAKVVMARRDLISFAEAVLRDENGELIEAAPIHQSWWEHLQYCWMIKKASLNLAPYAHGKSAWMALALPLWLLGQNPNFRIMMVSSAEDIAAKRLQKIAEYIKTSPEYHRIFPWVKLDNSKPNNAHALNVVREGRFGGMTGAVDYSVAAYGYTSSEGQGSRCDILIFDDVADEKNSCISPATRKNLQGLITTQWIPRAARPTKDEQPLKSRSGKIISKKSIITVIGTRFHEEDIYGFMMDSPDAYCSMIQGISEDFEHLDTTIIGSLKNPPHPSITRWRGWQPEKISAMWSTDELKGQQALIGDIAFERSFRQRPPSIEA